MTTTEQAAAETLQYNRTGIYTGVAMQNLRKAIGAGWWRANGEYVAPARQLPTDWDVPQWAWDDVSYPAAERDAADDRHTRWDRWWQRIIDVRDDRGDHPVVSQLASAICNIEDKAAALREELEKATWLLDGTGDSIEDWLPNDPDPIVQNDLHQFAGEWRKKYGFATYKEAIAAMVASGLTEGTPRTFRNEQFARLALDAPALDFLIQVLGSEIALSIAWQDGDDLTIDKRVLADVKAARERLPNA